MSLPETPTTPMSRPQRNAIFAAIAIMAMAFLNISLVITYTTIFTWQSGLEIAAMVVLIVITVMSMVRSSRGQVEQSAWMLMIAVMVIAIIRAALRQEIGLPFGILAAILASLIGTLILPINKADRALLFGYIFGSLVVIFDTFIGRAYLRLATPPEIVSAARNLAGVVFVTQIVLIMIQARSIGLAAKIANAISSITLIVVVLLGTMSISIINNSLTNEGVLSTAPLFLYGVIESLRVATIVMGAAVTILGSVLGVAISRSLVGPLSVVTETSTQLADGDLSARVHFDRNDEVGQVGIAFNKMADEMSGMVSQLESRVAERTSSLERRAVQIQTAAEIGSTAAKLRNLDQLLAQATQLISERFGFYHTGIFLLDERREFAILRAANSTGGQRMLSRGHRLKVGQVGIVGYVTGTGNPRIALDVGSDAVFFDNPDLPDTRSEMALPLIAAGQILGALDVQSTAGNAFKEDDINSLQVLADQVAIAIENARLFEENQAALETIRRAYGDMSQETWQKIQKAANTLGYISLSQGSLVPIARTSSRDQSDPDQQPAANDELTLSVPLKVRGQAIGSIRLRKPEHAIPWSAEEIALVGTLTDQLSGALESARLYQEAQLRAATERQTTSVVNQIRSSTAVDGILQNTIRELGKAFGATRTFISMDIPETGETISANKKQE